MRKAAGTLFCLVLFVMCVDCTVWTQSPTTAGHGVTRFYFGDDPDGVKGWAGASFDDSSWPVAVDGKWPEPALYSDGFVWIRFVAPVPNDIAGPACRRRLLLYSP